MRSAKMLRSLGVGSSSKIEGTPGLKELLVALRE
jgi:hypothetical protein